MGCCSKLLLIIGCLISGYAYFGRVIYGGIYWGKLRYWNDGYSQTDHLWLITLLQWIFGICLPIASDVMNCMIIHSTRKSNCNPQHMIFPPDVAAKIAIKYEDFLKDTEQYYEDRCQTPRKFFISFLVCALVGVFLIIIERAALRNSDGVAKF